MADIQGFSITSLGSSSVNVPRFQIQGLLCDPKTGAVLNDFTGVNAINFPDVLANLTAAQRQALFDRILTWLLHTRAGLA